MPDFYIGGAKFSYEIKLSTRFRHKRLTIAGEKVFVRGPEGTSEEDAKALLLSHQVWIYAKLRQAKECSVMDPWPERFMPGAKVFWKGRWEPILLAVQKADCEKIEIEFLQGFKIFLPSRPVDRQELIKAFEEFFLASNLPQSPESRSTGVADPA